MISRHRTEKNPAPAQPAPPPQPPTMQKEEATESMDYALDTAERGERMLQNTFG